MKALDLRALDAAELAEKLDEAKEELFNLRFQMATNQLDNTARVRQVRRSLLGQMVTEAACPRCHGKGTVISDPCKTCSGSGARDGHKQTCATCGGVGQVRHEDVGGGRRRPVYEFEQAEPFAGGGKLGPGHALGLFALPQRAFGRSVTHRGHLFGGAADAQGRIRHLADGMADLGEEGIERGPQPGHLVPPLQVELTGKVRITCCDLLHRHDCGIKFSADAATHPQ